ncbi:MAG: PEGA domain-containing protein [Bacteroidales bacterium]|nr:PEGA domain-containing protein [Bacteroidales bacterium]
MKKLFITFVLMLCVQLLYAQQFSVNSFFLAETDLTANTPGTMVYDQNGNLCALIKVETTMKDFTFDVGVLGIASTVYEPGEIWVYIPFGIRKLTVKHPEFGIIRDYPLTCEIEKGRTYILKLNLPTSAPGPRDPNKKQRVRVQVYPKDAEVEVNGISLTLDVNGTGEQVLSFGTYDLMVSAPKYHSIRRLMEVKDTSNVLNMNIHLKQAFGWLNIPGDGDEKLAIDGKPYAFRPGQPVELKSGHYKFLLEKPLYKPYEGTFEIKDSVVLVLAPEYVENFRELELKVYDQAEIWVDGVKMGTGSWKGKLEYGNHQIECKKENHRPTSMEIEVHPQTLGPIVLESPEPKTGYIAVTSTPVVAELYVDDKLAGHTPSTISSLIGQRKVTIKRNGYNTENKSVTVKEGETVQVDAKLSNNIPVEFTSTPKADIYIDGAYAGKTPYCKYLLSGYHFVKLTANGYKEFIKKIHCDEHHTDFSFQLKKNLYLSNSFVAGASCQSGMEALSIGGYIGGYISNIYIEGFAHKVLGSSESIYWNDNLSVNEPVRYTYSPLIAGGKLGYGLILGTRVRITPEVGAGLIRLNGKKIEGENPDFDPSACSSIAAVGGMKLSFALASCVELNVAPEYYYSVYKTPLYDAVYNISPTVQGWSEGFKLNVGVGLFF